MMTRRTIRLWVMAFAVLGMAVAGSEAVFGAAPPKKRPAWPAVEWAVKAHFAALPGYRPGDVVSRSQVEPLFARLDKIGFVVAEREGILEKVPPDSDFLVRQLRTNAGQKFMRRISRHPGAFDRLERISQLHRGKQTVRELIGRGSKGADVIAYLASDPDGKKANRMMSKPSKGGRDFAKPTGRIYTAEMLLQKLREQYTAVGTT